MKILVTGANGFVGKFVCAHLLRSDHEVRAAVRRAGTAPSGTMPYVVGNIDGQTDWEGALDGMDAVIHLAARVHVMSDTEVDPLSAFRAVNTDGALRLADQARRARVGTFVFMSSIKVNGEGGTDRIYDARSAVAPVGPYAVSKWEAEQGLLALADEGNFRVVSVRTPMIYGPGVRGNLERMIRLIDKGLPVPFSAVTRNQRTLLSVWNLASLLEYCATDLRASSCTVLAGDETSSSTFELYRTLAQAMDKPVRSFYVPVPLLRILGRVTGYNEELSRLTESLRVRLSATCPEFDWHPQLDFAEGIALTCTVPGRH